MSRVFADAFDRHPGRHSRVYGSLGGIAILMVWANYSSMILFIGAEIAADYGTGERVKE